MAPQHKPAGVRRLALGAAAVAASAALASGPVAGVGAGVARAAEPRAPAPTPPPPVATPSALTPSALTTPAVPQPSTPAPAATTPAATTPAPATTTPAAGEEAPAVGVFLKSDARGVARMPLFSHWLGGTELRAGHTYLPGHRWRDIEGAPGFLDVWAHWRNAKSDRMLVLNVPMQERNEEGVSDSEVRRLLQRGAAGEFDHHFRVLAERLVELKVPDTVLVLGWEMNGTTYTHRCGPDPEAWKKYWNRIVTTMRSVPGQNFRFDFTPSRGRDAVPWTKCYPGDDTVDIIGMDSYDQPAGMSFEQQVKEPYGLQDHVDFAKAHGKPISYPEWGLFRNGDNAEYMRSMLAWMDEHKPLYNTLTDYCPHGVWQCGANPKSSSLYRSSLFGRTDQATPPLVPTPKPTPPGTTPPPADCTPLDLGSWVEEWLGGKLCLRFDWW
ncbi:glycoside hydrolase family 26 protein [Streptomyces sp. NPDC056948]|uniref:glycoside hydrolase family 26 protein n=1 Tax=Streptomyces sp. NPDC056948 TaxID=3345975 RepID=UPI003628555D